MERRLREHHDRLDRWCQVIKRLRADLSFVEERCGAIHYAADWSELRSYLVEWDERGHKPIVGLALGDSAWQEFELRLAVTHLFRSFGAGGVYLLPPHFEEFSSWLRSHQHEVRRALEFQRYVGDFWSQLNPDSQTLLMDLDRERIPGQAVPAFDELRKQVRGDRGFAAACDDAAEWALWFEAKHKPTIQRLKELRANDRLRFDFDQLIPEQFPARSPFLPSPTDVDLAVQCLPRSEKKKRDARVLVYLREVNRRLVQRYAQLTLVSRDTFMPVAAQKLDEICGWDVGRHLVGLDVVFLDLILSGTPTRTERVNALAELEGLMQELSEAVSSILDRHRADPSLDIAQAGERVLQAAFDRWREYIKVQLSLATPLHDWIMQVQTGTRRPTVDLETELDRLRMLGRFIAMAEYRAAAAKEVGTIREELDYEGLKMFLLGHLGQEGADEVLHFVAHRTGEGQEQRTVIASATHPMVCALRFSSSHLANALAPVKEWTRNEDERKRRIIGVLLGAMREDADAEMDLFMAFVLGLLERWERARDLTRTLLLPGSPEALRAECEYFVAICEKKMATAKDWRSDPTAVGLLWSGYAHVGRAQDLTCARGDDPRFLKELATIACLLRRWSENAGAVGAGQGAPGARPLLSLPDAIETLRRALALATEDRRLRIEILNNLSFIAVWSPEHLAVEEAQGHCDRINRELQEAQNDRPRTLPETPWPAIRDTQIMVRARRARRDKDKANLEACLHDLVEMAGEKLTPFDRHGNEDHRARVQAWLEEVPAGRGG